MESLDAQLASHRPALVRHCYRMLGCFAEAEELAQDTLERAWRSHHQYRGSAPLGHWLHSIATHACLNALERRRPRAMPQLEQEPADGDSVLQESEPERWITPAPDARLFPDAAVSLESREAVALAYVALVQRVPPRQRAVLLLKDVLGWSAEEIAAGLELTVPAVNSALHRAREATARVAVRADEPSPETLRAFLRAWETRDLDALVELLRADATLAMPPHSVWFGSREALVGFLRTPRFGAFWAKVREVRPTRANGWPACSFHCAQPDGSLRCHSVMVVRFEGDRVAEMTTFIGPHYTEQFSGPRLS